MTVTEVAALHYDGWLSLEKETFREGGGSLQFDAIINSLAVTPYYFQK